MLAIAAPAAGKNGLIAHAMIELDNGSHIEINTDAILESLAQSARQLVSADFDDAKWSAATVLGRYGAPPWGEFITTNTIGPGRYVRKTFTVKGPIAKARLYATALGVYEASINGRRASDSVLDPGWTDYKKRVMVQTFDVTRLLTPGQNTLAAVIGDGWYAGRLGWMGLAQYGARPVFTAQLQITYADGSSDIIATDDSWKAGPGEIIGSDMQWGEIIDARKADLRLGINLVSTTRPGPTPSSRSTPFRSIRSLARRSANFSNLPRKKSPASAMPGLSTSARTWSATSA